MPRPSRRSLLLLVGLGVVLAVATALGYLLLPPRTVPPPPARPVTDARLLAADSAPGEWLTYGRDYANQRFSPVTRIDRRNVAQLVPVWHHSRRRLSRAPDRNESTPLVLDGMMVYSDSRNVVLALDARSGRLIWSYEHPMRPTAACCGLVNRGLAAYGHAVYLAALDARLVALDRRTGAVLWERAVAEPSEGYSLTMAPLAAAGRILVGAAGGDFGARGFLDAYDPRTGDRLWRFWTVPSPEEGGWWGRWTPTTPDGESLNRDIPQEKRDSARYADAWRRGGAAVWTTPAYDPELDLVIFTTGNPAPVGGVTPPGDNLYSTSLVAVHAATGQLAWYYQMVPHNVWDYDAASPPVLLSLPREGKALPAVAHAGKTGWVYFVERATGVPLLRSEPLIPLKNIFPGASRDGIEVSPGDRGGSNWPPAAYSPMTGLLYVQATHAPMIFSRDSVATAAREGEQPVYAKFHQMQPPRETGTLSAVDPATGRLRWQLETEGNLAYGGVLATAGGLVFFAQRDGHLVAVDAETGHILWRHRVDDRVLGSPMAFAVDGEQRIAIASIRGITAFGLR